MKNFDKVTLFAKFNVYRIVPEPSGADFSCLYQLATYIRQLMVFMANAP